jgi:hypothetical protein
VITALLFICYAIYIQYERGGLWNVCRLVVVVGYFVDVLANFTELALLTWDFPRWGEWTFSQRLPRLIRQTGWRSTLARSIARVLDWLAPSGRHIDA